VAQGRHFIYRVTVLTVANSLFPRRRGSWFCFLLFTGRAGLSLVALVPIVLGGKQDRPSTPRGGCRAASYSCTLVAYYLLIPARTCFSGAQAFFFCFFFVFVWQDPGSAHRVVFDRPAVPTDGWRNLP